MSQLPHSFTDIFAVTPRLGWVSSWNMLSLCCAALFRHSCKATCFQNPSILFFYFLFFFFLQPRHQMFLQPGWPCKTITPDLSGESLPSRSHVSWMKGNLSIMAMRRRLTYYLVEVRTLIFFHATQNPFGQFPLIKPRQQTEPPKLKQFSKMHFKGRAH